MSDDEFGTGADEDNSVVSDGGRSLLSRIFEALADPRRRFVLYYLRDHGEATVDDLAVHIAAWERDVPASEVSDEDTQQIAVELVHSHLPRLEDEGLVEYDPRTETVSYSYPPSLLSEALDIAAVIEDYP
jgi:DNA-binding transcriptional ArsR family regulator